MSDKRPQQVIVELCKQFYDQGWVSGTGGGISVRKDNKIYIAPSGVHKERMSEDEIYVLNDNMDKDVKTEDIIYDPNTKGGPYKISECRSLFMIAYKQRDAGAVIHSHSLSAMLVTVLFLDEFRCSHLEMIKGIKGHNYHDELVVPIIENKARECELYDEMSAIIDKYPKTYAVLVRNHGVYVWGKDWIECKTHAEVYDYLFTAVVELHKLGKSTSCKICGK